MTNRSPFKYFKTSSEIIRLAALMYVWFPSATHPYLCQHSLSFPVFPRFIGRLDYAICQRDDRITPSWRDFCVLSPEAPSGASVWAKFP